MEESGYKIEYLHIDELLVNERNYYSTEADDIDSLADAIRIAGLKQPVVVMCMSNGKYRILAGHRRYMAMKKLSEEDAKYESIPCKITTLDTVMLPISEESKEQYLISTTNAESRNYTAADQYKEYLTLKQIYEEARENGYALTAKMRKVVANSLQVSQAQVGKMEYIEKHGSQELKEEVLAGTISIVAANDIAHYSKEQQEEQIELVKSEGKRKRKRSDKERYQLTEENYEVTKKELEEQLHIPEEYFAEGNLVLERKVYAKYLKLIDRITGDMDKLCNLLSDDAD